MISGVTSTISLVVKTDLIKKGVSTPDKIMPYIWKHTQEKVPNIYRNISIAYNSRWGIGKSVFDFDWDVLIILDTCRVDALRTVANEYQFLSEIDSYWSIGGQSAEWMAKTFDKKYRSELNELAYITSNPHSETVLVNRLAENWNKNSDSHITRLARYGKWNIVQEKEIGILEKVYKYTGDEYGYPPRYVTDRAISVHREQKPKKMIVHYMPPHTPYTQNSVPSESPFNPSEEGVFDYLRRTRDRESVFKTYLNMLRWVLDDVRLLLENIHSEKVLITADHAEAFGEYGIFFHHAGSLHPKIRQVPIVKTSAKDTEEYEPSFEPDKDQVGRTTQESLEALGYL